MRNFLLNIPRDHLSQFYLHGTPDREICGSFYCVSDRTALNAFLGKQQKRDTSSATAENPPAAASQFRLARNCRNLVLRDLIWQSMRWWTKEFSTFLDDVSPEIVLLQAGDAPFMYRIARKIARKYHAKLVMFNTEHYVLKNVMYSYAGTNLFWHNILMCSLKYQYARFMDYADYCIYNTQALEAAYQKTYPHPGKSSVLYTTSTMRPLPDESGKNFSLLYCGNLGVGRCIPIRQLADILYEIDPKAGLDIYGKFLGEEDEKAVCGSPNVRYHGFVDYEELIPRMREATMLLHCENQNEIEELKFAFSTKIADSLASGKPFLVYASEEYPFVQYLKQNQCAHIANNPAMLREVLKKCMESEVYRNQFHDNACRTAARNHNQDVNCRKIEEIFHSV